MNRQVVISQFYGLEVLDYNIKTLKDKVPEARDQFNLNRSNAHIYAFAYQHGHQPPSLQKITKTVKKNTNGAELTVKRPNRVFRNQTYNPYQDIFRKERKNKETVKTKAHPKKQVFQVQSPEQIVIKCARQAYAREVLKKANKVKQEARLKSERQIQRKQHQKQRRLERVLILKAYKRELFAIFGEIIYSQGWKISREQLKDRLLLPPQHYNINFMKNILMKRQLKAALDCQIFMNKRKRYERQRYQRFKFFRYLKRYPRNTSVPHAQIEYPHKQGQLYLQKRQCYIKSRECKVEGERIKRLKKRKMRKQKVWYTSKYHPSRKEIQKETEELTVCLQDIEEEDLSDEEDIDNQEISLQIVTNWE